MSRNKIDLSESKLSNINEIQLFVEELRKQSVYDKASNVELIAQNKRILDILKGIQTKIDKQLEIHKKNMLLTNPNHKVTFNKDQIKLLEEKQSNNTKLISVLQKDFENIIARRKLFEDGLEQKTNNKKHQLEDKINAIKNQIKKLSQSQKQTQKKLAAYQNLSEADYFKQYARMQQQLRVYSAKYVKIVTKYNKVTQQLAIASQVDPQFQIPQEIYNKELQQKQQAQFKQYQSIVKLCTILSKRNDSQNNKSNRMYTEKLKQLQKTILHLTQLEKSISYKQTQILQGKKNIEMIKLKMANNQKVQKQLFRLSQGTKNSFTDNQLKHKSYSSVKLPAYNAKQQNSGNKLRSRGLSFAKLPTRIKQ